MLRCSYDERVLPSIGNEVLKATVAQFDGAAIFMFSDKWSLTNGRALV